MILILTLYLLVLDSMRIEPAVLQAIREALWMEAVAANYTAGKKGLGEPVRKTHARREGKEETNET